MYQTIFKEAEEEKATFLIRFFPINEEDWALLESADFVDIKKLRVLLCNSEKTNAERANELYEKSVRTPELAKEPLAVTPIPLEGETFAYIFLDKDISDGEILVSKKELRLI